MDHYPKMLDRIETLDNAQVLLVFCAPLVLRAELQEDHQVGGHDAQASRVRPGAQAGKRVSCEADRGRSAYVTSGRPSASQVGAQVKKGRGRARMTGV